MILNRYKAFWLWTVLAVISTGLLALRLSLPQARHQNVQLADGRVIEIEGVTYGLNHRIGSHISIGPGFLSWLSAKLKINFLPARPFRESRSRWPALMVWVNTVTNVTGGTAGCGEMRLEIVDDQGLRYEGRCYRAGSGGGFSWAGYCFEVYPRAQRALALEITPYYTNQATRVSIRNPHRVTPARWDGGSLPRVSSIGDLQLTLSGLCLRTNGSAMNPWETPTLFWEPVWELHNKGKAVTGWDVPEWTAEDQVGNHSRFIAFNQPVLRFDATLYPNATNLEETVLIGRSPSVALENLVPNSWSNVEFAVGSQKLSVLGLFPPGNNMFTNGRYVPSAPAWANPSSDITGPEWEGGDGSSGVFGQVVQSWQHHRTALPTLYLKAPELPSGFRVAVRIQDERGRWWPTKVRIPGPGELSAYVLDVPPEVKTVTAEIVMLKPVKAQFLVKTPYQRETKGNDLSHE